MEAVLLGARCAVALVFAAAVFGKLRSREAFRSFVAGVRAMGVLPERAVRPVAFAVAGCEAAVPVAVLVPFTASLGFFLAAGLLMAFTAAVLVVLRRGVEASCPCFGAATSRFGRRHVVRNLLLLAMTVTGAVPATAGPAGFPPVAAAVPAVFAGAVVALLVIAFEDLVDLVAPATAEYRRTSVHRT